MSSLRLVLTSLVYHWRTHLAVALGVAAGTAVLTGALLVGDSMRGSLRDLALERLGRIDDVLVSPNFFRAKLADELAARPGFRGRFTAAVPAILLPASLECPDQRPPGRANRVNLIACDDRFNALGHGGPGAIPDRQITLNRPLADALHAAVGDTILVRLPRPGLVPAESPLGRKQETVATERLTVARIVPAEGLGRFGLRPTQQLPRNAYVPLAWLQERLKQPGAANAILVAGNGADPAVDDDTTLAALVEPTWADCGIRVEPSPRGYLNITTDRLLFDPATERTIEAAAPGRVQPVLTYLANTIACGARSIPYSTITAIDFGGRPPLADDQIVLNAWAADDLGAKPGDTIRVSYFEPESTHGEIRERTVALRLAAIVPLEGAATDRDLTPTVPGVTDQATMAHWNPPFPYDARRIRAKDERYWEQYRATPKAFVSLAVGRRLWSSRFGRATSLRIAEGSRQRAEGSNDAGDSAHYRRPSAHCPLPTALCRLLFPPFQPIKRQALAAAAGTTPFNVLFLAFSFFIIAAAVMLVALLFRLGVEQRSRQLGLLAAVGFRRRKIARLLAGEGLVTAAAGSLVGVPLGLGYAALMLLGLRTWWLAAVATPFLRLHVAPASLAIGFVAGSVVALAAILWVVWRSRHVAPRQLLAGRMSEPRPRRFPRRVGLVLVIAAIALGLAAARLDEQAQAAAFFGTGGMVLAACLASVWRRLAVGATGPAVAVGRGNLLRMAARSAARNPGRSTLSIGLVAAACFLIVATSAFHADPTQQTPARDSGNGGFILVAESDQPIYHDLNTASGRSELGFSADDARLLAGTTTIALRVRPGDDASCLNLYRPRQPRMLGVPRQLVDRGGFAWSGPAAWPSLEGRGAKGDVPVVMDENTAMYSLHVGRGDTLEVTDGHGASLRLRVVGLLAGSIFQGDVLMSEENLLRAFPETSGYRFFLIDAPPERTAAVRGALERTLGDYGLATETTGRRLADFLAVQNTYLSTFQSLGGLGLLLGTFGLAAVQLRGVFERRGELALLRAVGFRRRTLAAMVLLENGILLVAGLAAGLAAAVVAVLPHLVHRASTIPWPSLAAMLAGVLLVGMLAGLVAVRAVLRAPLAALREEA